MADRSSAPSVPGTPGGANKYGHAGRTEKYWQPGLGPCRCDDCEKLPMNAAPPSAPVSPSVPTLEESIGYVRQWLNTHYDSGLALTKYLPPILSALSASEERAAVWEYKHGQLSEVLCAIRAGQ